MITRGKNVALTLRISVVSFRRGHGHEIDERVDNLCCSQSSHFGRRIKDGCHLNHISTNDV
jgi:hypothetical protein